MATSPTIPGHERASGEAVASWLQDAGIELTADLFVTGVVQETSAPFDSEPSFATWSGVGPKISQIREGFGCRWMIEHGVVADYALVGEITDFTVSVAQAGYLRLRIAVPGTVAYTPALTRNADAPGSPIRLSEPVT